MNTTVTGSRPHRAAATRHVDVIVVGAGQAGLATSHQLTALGIEHVVFERGEVGQRWRRERWDSLTLLTPNWMTRLPGRAYEGADPQGFMDKAAVADFLDDYADNLSVPVRTGMSVESAVPWGRGYRLRVNDEDWTCRAIVDASGACARGKLPAISAQLPNGLAQMHAADYRNPAQLCEGGVLVVGASATGLQIAEELQTHGHPVTLAVGEHVRMPRTYRGQDVYWWLDRSGVLHETIDDVDDIRRARRVPSPQLIGRAGCNMDLNRLQDAGVEIVGRLAGLNGSQAQFSGGLANHCKSADLKLGRLLDRFDESSAAGLTAQPAHRPEATRVPASRLGMDLASGEIATVFWATGFQPEHGWLELPVFDRKGHLMHDAGVVTQAPGVYTLGHTFLRSRKSSFMFGVEDDVKHITAYLQQHLDNTADAGLRANVI